MHGVIGLDSFDPRTWAENQHQHRIYLDDYANHYAVVDEEDYHWAIQWRWSIKVSRGGRKFYAYRIGIDANGVRGSWYLHVKIQERTGIIRPSDAHTIVDHRNGNSFDCTRRNLRWATPVMNRRNLFGQFPHDLLEG